jgi:hypothetical protein
MFIDEYCEDLEVILAYINSPSLGNGRDFLYSVFLVDSLTFWIAGVNEV